MADLGALAIEVVLAAAQAELAADFGDNREVVPGEPAIGAVPMLAAALALACATGRSRPLRARSRLDVAVVALAADFEPAAAARRRG